MRPNSSLMKMRSRWKPEPVPKWPRISCWGTGARQPPGPAAVPNSHVPSFRTAEGECPEGPSSAAPQGGPLCLARWGGARAWGPKGGRAAREAPGSGRESPPPPSPPPTVCGMCAQGTTVWRARPLDDDEQIQHRVPPSPGQRGAAGASEFQIARCVWRPHRWDVAALGNPAPLTWLRWGWAPRRPGRCVWQRRRAEPPPGAHQRRPVLPPAGAEPV